MLNRASISNVTVIAVIMLFGCGKNPSGPNGNSNALTTLFETNRTNSTQEFVVQAGVPAQITGTGGVRVVIGDNTFRTATGGAVSGAVNVSLLEILSPGDMVWNNVQTIGLDGGLQRPLVSGGAIRLTATQSGNELQMTPGTYTITVLADQPDPSMGLFVGTEEEGTVLWDPVDTATVVQDTTGWGNGGWGYSFYGNGFNWVNCDYFMNAGGVQTGVTVAVPSDHSPLNTQIWLVFPNSNSVIGLSAFSSSAFSTGTFFTLPVGLPVVVVGLFNVGTEYRSGFLSTTVSNGMSATLDFEPTTLAEFDQDCQGL